MFDKLEKKFGKYAINNLIIYLLIGYAIGYMLQFGQRFTGIHYLDYLKLEPYYVIHGLQLWRLVTWVIIPPSGNIIVILIMFLLYYQLGSTLERTWGAFKFNVYIFGGLFLTAISAFVVYAVVMSSDLNASLYLLDLQNGNYAIGNMITTEKILMTIFLAFAVCFPDMQVLLYFIIPVKMKWMAIIYAAVTGYTVLSYIYNGYWLNSVPIIASVLNFVVFYMSTRNMSRYNPKEIHRRAEFRRQATPPRTHYRDGSPISKHKCAVCGRTELTNPELEFRFCSKCNGNYEYCSDHLFTHNHVK